LTHVDVCWRNVVSWFGRPDAFDATSDPTVAYYPGNYFAVLPEGIRRHSLSTWRSVYDRLIVNNTCTAHGVDPDRGKHHTAGAFEHLAHIIWGGHDAGYSGPHFVHDFVAGS
jgi:hypothetical protein